MTDWIEVARPNVKVLNYKKMLHVVCSIDKKAMQERSRMPSSTRHVEDIEDYKEEMSTYLFGSCHRQVACTDVEFVRESDTYVFKFWVNKQLLKEYPELRQKIVEHSL